MPPGMPPDNASYFYAAYALAAFIYVGYAALLVRRRARVRRALAAHGAAPGAAAGEATPPPGTR